jgi:hypothetical protein
MNVCVTNIIDPWLYISNVRWFQMDETVSRCMRGKRELVIYWISSHGQPTRSPPDWGFGGRLTTIHLKINKLGNGCIAWQFWLDHQNLPFNPSEWQSFMEPMTCVGRSYLSGCMMTSRGCATGWEFPTWGFPTQTVPPAETHVKSPFLLSDFNQNWHVSTSFSESSQYQISWKSVLFSSCYMPTDRHDESSRRSFAMFL